MNLKTVLQHLLTVCSLIISEFVSSPNTQQIRKNVTRVLETFVNVLLISEIKREYNVFNPIKILVEINHSSREFYSQLKPKIDIVVIGNCFPIKTVFRPFFDDVFVILNLKGKNFLITLFLNIFYIKFQLVFHLKTFILNCHVVLLRTRIATFELSKSKNSGG